MVKERDWATEDRLHVLASQPTMMQFDVHFVDSDFRFSGLVFSRSLQSEREY